MSRDHADNRRECAGAERFVRGDRDGLGRRRVSAKDDMTADLAAFQIVPIADKVVCQVASVQVAWNLRATASTCSTWRKRRMRSGGVES
jgi:hypothetical protein